MTQPLVHAFSVDVEDGISIAMRDRFQTVVPQTDRVVRNTRQILAMLREADTRATFFVLGQVAETFPGLVREIAESGHELGVHGYDHILFSDMGPERAREEVGRAKAILEEISGSEVIGHRAPRFSINRSTSWAWDVLLEAGFKYDSSVMPCAAIGYGWPDHSPAIGEVKTPKGGVIVEVPLSVVTLFGKRFPGLGGSYFRLLPYPLCKWMLSKVQKERPAIVYLHPYELDTARYPEFYLQRLRRASTFTRLRMRSFWLRRGSLAARYTRLLKEHRFVPIKDLLSGGSRGLKASW